MAQTIQVSGNCFLLKKNCAFVFEKIAVFWIRETSHNSRHIQDPIKYLWWKILFTTLCNPGIFRTVSYSESKAYSEYYQTSITKYFIQNLVSPDIFRTLLHSQVWCILKIKYIENPANIWNRTFYYEPCVTIADLEALYIKNFRIFRTGVC